MSNPFALTSSHVVKVSHSFENFFRNLWRIVVAGIESVTLRASYAILFHMSRPGLALNADKFELI